MNDVIEIKSIISSGTSLRILLPIAALDIPRFPPVSQNRIEKWIKESKKKIDNGWSRLQIISSQGGISIIPITGQFCDDIWETIEGLLAMGIAYFVILK